MLGNEQGIVAGGGHRRKGLVPPLPQFADRVPGTLYRI
jgi:hypothetical protein